MNANAADEGALPTLREGVVVVVREGERYLIIRRAQVEIAPGAWCFVGGGIEPGETQAEAVCREFAEEVRGIVRPLRKVWEYRRSDGKLLLHWWLAVMESSNIEPNPAEVADARWYTEHEILALPDLLGSNREFLAHVQSGVVMLDFQRDG